MRRISPFLVYAQDSMFNSCVVSPFLILFDKRWFRAEGLQV